MPRKSKQPESKPAPEAQATTETTTTPATAPATNKGKAKKPEPFKHREFVSHKHDYNGAELTAITGELTRSINDVNQLEDDKKAIMADFTSRIKTAKARVNEANTKLTTGYEMRQVQADVTYNRERGTKRATFHCPDDKKMHGKPVGPDEPMNAADFQRLPLDLPPESTKKKDDNADEATIKQVIELIRTEQSASVSLIQRRLSIGYTKATRIMDELERRGAVGPSNGAEPREIIDLDASATAGRPKPVSADELQAAMNANTVKPKAEAESED